MILCMCHPIQGGVLLGQRYVLALLFMNPWYADRFVLAGVVHCMDLSVEDSIELGGWLLAVGAVGEMSCGSTGCLSCQGK